MKKTFYTVCLVLLTAFSLPALSFWEGSAVVSTFGELPQSGSYGACASFPRNSVVEIENLENGKKTQVIITQGLDNPGIFISLSAEAASRLGIGQGSIYRVRVSLPEITSERTLRSDNLGHTDDPDLNPEALVSRFGMVSEPVESTAPTATQAPAAAIAIAPTTTEKAVAPTATREPAAKAPEKPVVQLPPDAITAKVPEQRVARASAATASLDAPQPIETTKPIAVEAKVASADTHVSEKAAVTIVEQKPEAISYLSEPKGSEASVKPALSAPILPEEPKTEVASTTNAVPVAPEKPVSFSYIGRRAPARNVDTGVSLADPALEPEGLPSAELARLKNPKTMVSYSEPLIDAKLPDISVDELAEALALRRPKAANQTLASAALVDPVPLYPQAEAKPEALGKTNLSPSGTKVSYGQALDEPKAESALEELPEALGKSNLNPAADKVSYAEPLDEPNAEYAAADGPEALGKTALKPTSNEISYVEPLNEPSAEYAANEAPEALGKNKLNPSANKTAYAAPLGLPDSSLAETGAPEAMSKTALAAPKKAEKVSFSVPNPETTDVNLVATAENPPAPDAVGKVALNPKKPSAVATAPSLSSPEIAPKVEVALTPHEALPPVERKPEVVESLAKGAEVLNKMGAVRLDNLAKGTYYIQIGVFKAATGAAQRLKVIGMDYPIVYQEVTLNSTPVYKLFVGPVNKDESGLILLKLKSQGFTDVFLKKAN